MFNLFKKKLTLEEKCIDILHGKIYTPYNFTNRYNPTFEKGYGDTYYITYKVDSITEDTYHDVRICVDSCNKKLEVNFALERKLFLRDSSDILKVLSSLEKYFGVTPTCFIWDGDECERIIFNADTFLDIVKSKHQEIGLITREYLSIMNNEQLLEYIGSRSTDCTYKDYLVYDGWLILMKDNIPEDRIVILKELLDQYPINETNLNKILKENNFILNLLN